MTSPRKYTYEEVVELVRQLSEEERTRLFDEIRSENDPIRDFVLQSFKDYERTFKALAV